MDNMGLLSMLPNCFSYNPMNLLAQNFQILFFLGGGEKTEDFKVRGIQSSLPPPHYSV